MIRDGFDYSHHPPAHGTSWDESFVFPVDIQVEKSGVLAPLVIRLSVREVGGGCNQVLKNLNVYKFEYLKY